MSITILSHLTTSSIARFWAKVNKAGNDECWEWQACKTEKGYGQIRINSKAFRAHRVSWTIANNKDIQKGLIVCHTCDNPSCCNPRHLFVGTHAKNTKDKVSKGRQARGKGNGNSILTPKQVLEIRRRYSWYVVTHKMLADEFNVSETTIRKVLKRVTWSHI